MKKLLFITSITIFLFGCKQNQLSPDSFIEWVQEAEDELTVTKAVGDFQFILKYVPNSWLAIRELGDDFSQEAYSRKMKEKDSSIQFFLKVRHTSNAELTQIDIDDESEYMQKQNYFAYDMQQDLTLFSGNDTLSCAFMHYEKDYGISPYDTFVIGFPNKGTQDNLTFSFDAHQLGIGPVQMEITKETINNIPELII